MLGCHHFALPLQASGPEETAKPKLIGFFKDQVFTLEDRLTMHATEDLLLL